MKNILVPVGSTANGINNLKNAIILASLSGGKVYLINVYKEFSKVASLTKVNQLLLDENEEQLNQVLKAVDTNGVEIVSKAVIGNPFEAISRVSKQLNIDLIILSPQSIEIDNDIYLGKITGKIVKQAETPILIIPKDYKIEGFDSILFAFKNGVFENEAVLNPLKQFVNIFNSKLNLLQVITPDLIKEYMDIDKGLMEIKSSFAVTNNATTFQGVLEHFQVHNPDILCVIRRRRGFFKKLWGNNIVYKRDFHTTLPLLVLRGSILTPDKKHEQESTI